MPYEIKAYSIRDLAEATKAVMGQQHRHCQSGATDVVALGLESPGALH